MTLIFKKQPITQQLAKELRAASTKRPDLHGHSFKYTDLKQLWLAGTSHAVLTHDRDQVWQYWYRAPVGGWQAISIHDSMQDAQDSAATSKYPEEVVPAPTESTAGTFVMFRSDEDRPWHAVLVQSADGVKKLTDLYASMGYETKIDTVS